MSGTSVDWDALQIERQTEMACSDGQPLCSECDGLGQDGMERDGSPLVCEACSGSGREPTPEEVVRRADEAYENFFGRIEPDEAA